MMLNEKMLAQLCLLPGVSGDEGAVRDFLIKELEGHCDELTVDALGNLIAFKKGARQGGRLMLSAHMDEVGFVVTSVEEDGSVRFDTVGGIGTEILPGKLVRHAQGAVGVLMTKPVHLLSPADREKPVEKTELRIDFGTNAAEFLQPGDTLCFDAPFEKQEEHRILSKALDDRAGCLLLLDLLKEPLPYDVYAVFTVLEEVGGRGALTAANRIRPDYFIAVETTTAADLPGAEGAQQVCALGRGAVVPFMDRGTIYDKELYRLAFRLAEENGVRLQTKTMVAGGNDAGTVHRSGTGVKSLALALPCRYLHTAGSIIDTADYDSAAAMLRLLCAAVPGL